MASDSRPDILVAVDLGTTFTGVGWARPQEKNALQSPVQVIYNWPGCSTRNEQKVHTCLIYGKNQKKPSSWGFLCEDSEEPDAQRREFFKIFLDKMNLLEAQIKGLQGAPESIEQAQQFVTDYLHQVYVHVKSTIEHQTGVGPFTGWNDLAVEFIFSVPTTWRSLEVINIFKAAIKDAGFGTEGPKHTAAVELTESEAAAVATIKSTTISFEKDDIFLTVDAGGGTTDFALMQVVDAREPFPALKQLTQVDGVGIGSTLIDRAFLELVEDRIFPYSDLAEQLPPDCIENLVRSDKFKTTKHKFGEKVYSAATYKLPMEGMGFKFNHKGAGIESGRFLVTREEMQSLFDPHIKSMLNKIREQLDFVQLKAFGNPQVKYLILSGGLGSSAYVREQLQEDLTNNPHPNAAQVKIISAADPQLVVVKGLLLDRLQKLESGSKPVLVTRKARTSYGLMCKIKYNPEIHFQEELKTDPLDGETYAMSQIDWLIKKGDDIDPSVPIVAKFSQKIEKGSSVRHWDSVVVISHNEPEFLPVSMKDAGVKQLCTVRSDLCGVADSDLDPRRQSRGLFARSKKWFNCDYEVRATVGPADLTFELWYRGKKLSKDHSPIKVTWDEEGAASAPPPTIAAPVAEVAAAAAATTTTTAAAATTTTAAAAATTEGQAEDVSEAGSPSAVSSAAVSVSGQSVEGPEEQSAVSPASSLEEEAEIAVAFQKAIGRPRVLSAPPPVMIRPPSAESTKDKANDFNDADSAKLINTIPPALVIEPPSPIDNPNAITRPRPDRARRVMSVPPGMLGRAPLSPAMMYKANTPLRLPRRLTGEQGRFSLSTDGEGAVVARPDAQGRWSDVPAHWRHAIDPLRCHSVDQLPPPAWQMK